MEHRRGEDGLPIFDNLDVDLFVKVLANTAFSEYYRPISPAVINHSLGPFFVFLMPIFYIFQGAKLTDPIIIASSIYYVLVSAFCRSRSRQVDLFKLTRTQGLQSGIQNCTAIKEASFSAQHLLTGANKLSSLLVVRSYIIKPFILIWSTFSRCIWYR